MFNTFNFMAINSCCILGGPYYPTLPYVCMYVYTMYISPATLPWYICIFLDFLWL